MYRRPASRSPQGWHRDKQSARMPERIWPWTVLIEADVCVCLCGPLVEECRRLLASFQSAAFAAAHILHAVQGLWEHRDLDNLLIFFSSVRLCGGGLPAALMLVYDGTQPGPTIRGIIINNCSLTDTSASVLPSAACHIPLSFALPFAVVGPLLLFVRPSPPTRLVSL